MPRTAKKTRSNAGTAAENSPRGMLAGTMQELAERFGTEEQCEKHLISLKFPGGFRCPKCGRATEARIPGRRGHHCTRCGWQFSATGGAVMAHAKAPLVKWFQLGWQLVHGKRGISAMEAAELVGVSDRCALHMPRRMRVAMARSQALCKVGGEAQLDDAYISAGERMGGRAGSGGRGASDAPFIVAVSPTRMAVRATSGVGGGTYREFAAWRVSRLARVSADGWNGITGGLADWESLSQRRFDAADEGARLPAAHHAVSNFKAMVTGTHHGVTAAHLQEYCDQFAWRYNHRPGDPFADLLYDMARWPRVPKRALQSVMAVQPPGGAVRNRKGPSNRRARERVMAVLDGARANLCSLLAERASAILPATVTHA